MIVAAWGVTQACAFHLPIDLQESPKRGAGSWGSGHVLGQGAGISGHGPFLCLQEKAYVLLKCKTCEGSQNCVHTEGWGPCMGTLLRHVLLLQKDVAKAARFYSEGLDLPITALTDRWAELGAGPSRIALKAVEGYVCQLMT